MSTAPRARPGLRRRAGLWLAAAAVSMLALLAVAGAPDPAGLRRAWMTALLVASGPALGGLGLLLLGHLAGGAWFEVARPRLEALAWSVPMLALLALPLLGGFADLYPPAAAEGGSGAWRGGEWIAARLAAFALLWTFLAWLAARARTRAIGALGLVLYVPTVSLAAIDWLMGITPGWTSSVTGLLFIAQALLAALACVMMLGGREEIGLRARRRLAGLLLAALLGVAYLAFVQFLVMWMANLPGEAAWYLRRLAWLGPAVPALFTVLAVAAMLAALPMPRVRGGERAPTLAAALAFAAYVLHRVWEVAPSFALPPPLPLLGAALAAMAVLGGATLLALAPRRAPKASASGRSD